MSQWLITSVVIGAFLLCFFPDKRRHAIRNLPCPPHTLPVLGNTLDIVMNQLPRLHDWITEQCQYLQGKTWRFHLLGAPPTIVVSSVECFEDVIKTQFHIFDKGPRMYAILSTVLGDSIGAVDGEKWIQQRKAMSHLFSRRQFNDVVCTVISKQVVVLGQILQQATDRGDIIDFGLLCHSHTFDIFSEIAFGVSINTMDETKPNAFFQAVSKAMELLEKRFHQPDWLWQLKQWLQVGDERELTQVVKTLDTMVYSIIEKALSLGQQNTETNIITIMMKESKMNSKYLRDISLITLLAGKDSTGITLTWCIIMMNRYPHVLNKLRQDLKQSLPQLFTDPSYVPSMNEVEQLVYLEAVIRETLRLYPVIPLNAKESNQDTTLCDGTFIKQGTRVYIPSYTLARMSQVWGKDATEFIPERFLEYRDNQTQPTIRTYSPYQFISFHGGPRICLGIRFAMLELKTTLAYVLSKYNLQTTEDPASYKYQLASALLPDRSVNVHVTSY